MTVAVTWNEGRDPVVSICIPSFNRAELIRATLDSVVGQTYPAWEALVVDDGSSDDSLQVVRAYCERDSRIRLLERDRQPKGACTCRNIAVESATGRYVMFLDSDDLLAPFCLQQRVSALDDRSDLAFAIFPMLLFKDSVDRADRLWNVDKDEDDFLRVLRLDPVCQGTGTLWRRADFIRLGEWNEGLGLWQDIELHLRAFISGAKYLKRFDLPADVFLRETDASLSRGGYNSREKLESRATVARLAVRLLREAGRAGDLPEVRYLSSSAILGAIASGNLDIARDVRAWSLAEGVLSAEEARRLRQIEWFRVSRLDRLAPVRMIRDKIIAGFTSPSTLGQVRSAPSRG